VVKPLASSNEAFWHHQHANQECRSCGKTDALDRARRRTRCSPHVLRHFPTLCILAAENLRHNRDYQEYLLRQPSRSYVSVGPVRPLPKVQGDRLPMIRVSPMRENNPMQTKQLPDISVDFMTWLNAELRKRIDDDEDSRTSGLVNRLKTYFGRPVEIETAEA
jgi:hypothetical protein